MILHDPIMGSSGIAEAQAATTSLGMEVQIFEAADPFAREMDHMAECVLRDQKPRTPGEEGLRDMILMEAIYRAAKDRRTVSL
jgi:predicted dehydrogenase